MDGVLVVDKPAGPTSHDVVAAVRRALGEKKVGHTGTLDPVATGVLPLVFGRATKVSKYLTGRNKMYEAVVCLGATTDTLDAEGKLLSEQPVEAGEEDVRAMLSSFVGEIDQIPPMYSAKKHEGKRLYELARQGVEVERQPKRVEVFAIEMTAFAPPEVTLNVHCSAGTYVRVLAADLGHKLGCGGHIRQLRRVSVGAFSLAESITLKEAVEQPAVARTRMIPLNRALADLPSIAVPPHIARMLADGHQLNVGDLRRLDMPEFASDQPLVLALDDGAVVAVARALMPSSEVPRCRRDRQVLKTERVLSGR